ncbi:Serpin-ZX [Bienertia sinuspersici]
MGLKFRLLAILKSYFLFEKAIYIKEAWDQKFDASNKIEVDYYSLNGNSIIVPFITNNKKQFVKAIDGFKVPHLPYKQGEDNKHQFSIFHLDLKLLTFFEGLGVESPFTKGGLTEMTDSLEINEEGTEAAASTSVTVNFCSANIVNELEFVSDLLFMFIIREDITRVVLFTEHIMNPLES